jgi:ribosomal protein S18 acetylase RimI-like enzyme
VSDSVARIAAFERALQGRLATRTEATRFGTAYLNERFPLRWYSNFLWVERPLRGVPAEELAADADGVLGRAGLEHRLLCVEDAVEGERLAPGLAALGYEVERNLVMLHGREPDRPGDATVEELDVATAVAFAFAHNLDAPDFEGPVEARSLAEFRRELAERVGARFFGARAGGEVVSMCELRRLGDVAQIENVDTLMPHRGRGLARAVVLAALRAAREDRADLVFLGADAQDWPKHLYARLGFDEVARSFDFVRRPGAQRA